MDIQQSLMVPEAVMIFLLVFLTMYLEIILILKEEAPLRCLVRLEKLCGLKIIHPSIKLDKAMSQQFKEILELK